jgi:hypothetical protein
VRWFLFLIVLPALILLLWWNASVVHWTLSLLLTFVAQGAAFFLTRSSQIFANVTPRILRTFLVHALFFGPFIALWTGEVFAENVTTGVSFRSALLPKSVLEGLGIGDRDIRFLGHVSEYDFYSIGEPTVVLRSQSYSGFSLEWHGSHYKWRIPFVEPRRMPGAR